MDECDLESGEGCNENEICRSEMNEEDNSVIRNYCHCLIDSNDVVSSDSCEYKRNCADEESQVCNGNGKCVKLQGKSGYTCFCNIEYGGEHCSERRTCEHGVDRYQRPCLNEGFCDTIIDDDVNYHCRCAAGFYGRNCENIHPCHPMQKKVASYIIY